MEEMHLYHTQYQQKLLAFQVIHFQQHLYIHCQPSDVYLVFQCKPQLIDHPPLLQYGSHPYFHLYIFLFSYSTSIDLFIPLFPHSVICLTFTARLSFFVYYDSILEGRNVQLHVKKLCKIICK